MTAFADLHPPQIAQIYNADREEWGPAVRVEDVPHVCEEGCCTLVARAVGAATPRTLHASRDAEVLVWIPVEEAARRLDVSGQTVRNWIGRHRLTARRDGVRWLVSEVAIEARRTFKTPDERKDDQK